MNSEIDLSRGRYAIAALKANVAMDVAMLACSLVNLWLFSRLVAGEHVGDDQITAIDGATGIISLIALVALVFAAVTFIRWLMQARRNVEVLGARGLVHSREWAVWGWFVPFLNLFRPYQVVDEVWRGSDPQPGRPFATMSAATPSLLGLWWGVWILNGVLGQAVFRMQMALDESSDLSAFILVERVSLVSGVVSVGAALLAMRVVRGIDARQRDRALRMAAEAQAAREPVLA
ncbi:MAG TPA: DUF4328 domain-containing protein [Longimicrobium sp.]|nr:DUF4328 domain-containing protein [Longimicrobium sp.]